MRQCNRATAPVQAAFAALISFGAFSPVTLFEK